MRKCNVCKQSLDDGAFRDRTTHGQSKTCKKCQNRKGKLCYLKRRSVLIEKLSETKLQLGCCLCGWKKYDYGLDLHHNGDDAKIDTVANLLNRGQYGMGILCQEISKCVVVCACCHRAIHHGDAILPKDTKTLNFAYKDRKIVVREKLLAPMTSRGEQATTTHRRNKDDSLPPR